MFSSLWPTTKALKIPIQTMASGRKISTEIIQQLISNRIKDGGGGMDRFLAKLRITNVDTGKLTAVMKVDEEHSNIAGTMHGGMTCYLTDAVSSLAMLTCPDLKNFGVSVNMNVVFMKGAVVGEEVEIRAKADKLTNKLAFLSVVIVDKKSGDLIATASHVKYTGNNKPGTLMQNH